jgi:hypothetical protein
MRSPITPNPFHASSIQKKNIRKADKSAKQGIIGWRLRRSLL